MFVARVRSPLLPTSTRNEHEHGFRLRRPNGAQRLMLLELSHGAETIYESAMPSTEVLVGTIQGIVRIERGANGWTVTEVTLRDSHVHALLFEPESRIWFAGISHDGIYASTDGGRSWEKRDRGVTENDIYTCRGNVNLSG